MCHSVLVFYFCLTNFHLLVIFVTEKTRMHSSRMRTGRSLTVCRSLILGVGCLLLWGVSALGGVHSGGCPLRGVSAPRGPGDVSAPGGGIPACTEADTPLVNRMTDRCKNITLATTSLRPVITYRMTEKYTVSYPDKSCLFINFSWCSRCDDWKWSWYTILCYIHY